MVAAMNNPSTVSRRELQDAAIIRENLRRREIYDSPEVKAGMDQFRAELAERFAKQPFVPPRKLSEVQFDYDTERREGWAVEEQVVKP